MPSTDLSRQEKEYTNLQTGQGKLLYLKNRKKILKRNEQKLKELWYTIKWNNIHNVRVPEGEEREKGIEKIFEEIMSKKFPDLMKS